MNKVFNKQRLTVARDHLVHVLPRLEVSGCYAFALTLIRNLKNYSHTVLYENDLLSMNPDYVWHLQAAGASVLNVDLITPETVEQARATGAILYNVREHPGIGDVLPTIYYSYGDYDSTPGSSVVVPCSRFASRTLRDGTAVELDEELIVPPAIIARGLRAIESKQHAFTVGVLTSGAYNKYPGAITVKLLSLLPKGLRMMLTVLPRYDHPGMALAVDSRAETEEILLCPARPNMGIHYLLECDVLICASSEKHHEPYGRMAVEAMAMGKTVICENRGVYPQLVEHGVNGFLYDSPEDILGYINKIDTDKSILNRIGVNARMRAGWEDVTVHTGKIKRVLRMIGV